jgi:hypothetical protein
MARKQRPSRKEQFDKIRESVDKQRQEAEDKLPAIAKDSGGSIDKLPVKTKAFNKWLTEHQDANPFIGKHVTSAPEYNVSQNELEQEEVEATPELLKSFETTAFNPESDDGLVEEDLGEAPKVNNESDKKFIDITITENATRRLSDKTNEEIQEHAINSMRSYHDDSEYTPEVNLEPIIEHAKVLLLESGNTKKKYLR